MLECDLLLLVDIYKCVMQVMWIWTYHIVSCCCQNFEEFIKYWPFLQLNLLEKVCFRSVKKLFYLKQGYVKSPNSDNCRGKSARANWSFQSNFSTISCLSRNRGKLYFHFQKTGVNSQSSKNRGKITISLWNRGKNAKAPFSFNVFMNVPYRIYDLCLCSIVGVFY